METNNSIKKNIVLNIIYTITNMVFPLITFPYVSRILLSEALGKVSFFTAVSNYAIMIASLGISTYGIRAVAKVRNNRTDLSKVVEELLIINTITTIIVVGVLLSSIRWVDKFQNDYELLLINCVLILGTPIGMNWFYSGLEQYSYITKRSIFFKTVSLILVFLLVKNSNDYYIYALITVFSSVTSYVCNFIYARKFCDYVSIKQLKFRRHYKQILVLFASILAVNIYTNLDTVMLGFICGDKEVGLYSVAVKVKAVLLTLVNAISAVLLPRLSYYLSEKKNDEFNKVLKKSTSLILLISLPLAVLFIIEAKDSILVLGGEDYIGAVLCMQIIMPILVISGISNITGNQILLPNGKDSFFMVAVIMGAAVDLIMNLLLMPHLGCVGAAIATLLAETTQMGIQMICSKKYLRGNINWIEILKIMLAVFVTSMLVLLLKSIIFINNGFVSLLFFSGFYILIYFILLLLFKEYVIKEIVIKSWYKLKEMIC